MSNMKSFRGYGCSAMKQGEFIPQRIQNMMIRQYAESRDFQFLLTAFEYNMDDCFMMLRSVLKTLEGVDGIIFFSLRQLPESAIDRKQIYDAVLAEGKELHFALEQMAITSHGDLENLEDIIHIRQLSEGCAPAF